MSFFKNTNFFEIFDSKIFKSCFGKEKFEANRDDRVVESTKKAWHF